MLINNLTTRQHNVYMKRQATGISVSSTHDKKEYLQQYVRTPKRKFVHYKVSAKKIGKEFLLTFEEFEKLISQNCNYCGGNGKEEISGLLSNSVIKINNIGIDRINSGIGYISGNVVPCCTMCNIMKNCFTEFEFFKRVEQIYNYRIKEKS